MTRNFTLWLRDLRGLLSRAKPGLLGLLLGAAPLVAAAAPFTPGNIVVVRVGDGSALLTSAATPVFLVEYTPTGTLVQTIALPTVDAGTNQSFTNSGTATSDNNMTRSADGRYLVLTGYDAAVGTSSVTGTTSTANNRVVGRVAADGTVDTSTRISDAFSGTNFRSAASVDGSSFYTAGGNSGIHYLPFGNNGTTTALSTGSPVNFRSVNIFRGNLYVSSSANPNYGLNQIGTGLPTAAGAAVTLLPGFPSASGPSPYGFYFADLSPAVAGVDVVYVTDDNATEGIQKWSLVGGSWILNGTIGGSATAQLRGLTATTTGTAVALVASGGGGLYAVTDNAGYNAAPSTATLPAPFATPGTNTAFRGVALAPVTTALATSSARWANEVAVFPNPTSQVLTVQLQAFKGLGQVRVTLCNSLGQQVISQLEEPTSVALHVAGLASGVYLLRVAAGTTVTSQRVVVSR
jgi:hypothetical protein